MTYTHKKQIVLISLILYVVIGFAAYAMRTDTEDTYPFFSWFLYVTVPPRVQTGFDIKIVSVNKKTLETPVSPLSRPEVFTTGSISTQDLANLAQRLGRAEQSNQDENVKRARVELEKYFKVADISYTVNEFVYDPIEYFKSRSILSTKILSEYSVNTSP